MAISEAQRRAVAKYNAANYDRIEVKTPKGRKEEIRSHAARCGETVNKFIIRAIDEAMERDASKSGKGE